MATFQAGQELAISLTEKEMKSLWPIVLQSYRDAYKSIDDDIAKVYAKYLSTTDKQDYYNIMIQYNRLETLQKEIAIQYTAASKKAGVAIAKSSQVAISNSFYREQFTLSWFSPGGEISFSVLNPKIIEASVFGTADLWKQIQTDAIKKIYGNPAQYFPPEGSLTSLLAKNRKAEILKIQQSITTGLIRGASYTTMRNEVADVIGRELVKDGTRAFSGAKAMASRIVRTEGTRNLNAGFSASLHDAEDQGLDIQKQWVATLDATTRHSHASADGQRVGMEEDFKVNGSSGPFPGQLSEVGQNVNCRCSHIGIVDGEAPTGRRGRNPVTGESEVFSYKDFNQWADDHNMKRNKAGALVPK